MLPKFSIGHYVVSTYHRNIPMIITGAEYSDGEFTGKYRVLNIITGKRGLEYEEELIETRVPL